MINQEEAFDIYMAKKDSGKPKDDYPSKRPSHDNLI
jgi:hypothetical protein